MTILGIETSCDETSAAICHEGKIINNVIATQTVHKTYGGVVPELASRAHQKNIIPVVYQSLDQVGLTIKDISAISYTKGPGLLGALLVGSAFSKSIAYCLDRPLIPIHHLRAHVFAHFIDDPKPKFPFLCLIASGGHTQIVQVDNYFDMAIIGQTQDDAVGEAFDKCAKMLGLPYPGGPFIDKYAQKGNSATLKFAETNMPNFDYSFSGIKTSVLYFLREQMNKNENFIAENLHDICASIQISLVKMLMKKFTEAAEKLGINQLAIAGGVASNLGLRNVLLEKGESIGATVYIPKFEYCTDNAAMIAMAGHLSYAGGFSGSLKDSPQPRMPF